MLVNSREENIQSHAMLGKAFIFGGKLGPWSLGKVADVLDSIEHNITEW